MSLRAFAIVFSAIAALILTTAPLNAQTPLPRLVFAHYLVAEPSYSDDLAGYTQEIRDAQRLGIDGFALNVGGWSKERYYKDRVSKLFEAAKRLNGGFRLFFSVDMCCGLPASDVRDMVATYAKHPNYFKQDGRPVLTTFVGQGLGLGFWQDRVLRPLRTQGKNIFFVPFFYSANGDFSDPTSRTFNNPNYTQISANYFGWWRHVVDGLSYFSIGGLPSDIVSSGEAYARLMAETGKMFLAGTSPYFWEGRLDPVHQPHMWRRYYDYRGGEGIAAQWDSIINVQQPAWVMICTYNDFTESYISPAAPSQIKDKVYYYNVGPLLKDHSGYAELEKYYIQWYKAGRQPVASTDALFYFYRTHSKTLSAPNDVQNIVLYGEVADEVYVTTNLTQPATLRVTSGGNVSIFDLNAGLQHTRVPAYPGAQSFDLLRDGAVIIHKDGDPIDSAIAAYNYTTTSGFGYGSQAAAP